ncbi:MAG: discoidin domain-containing protein [Akkermansiaceae bacterium]|nr:discoidin domain-containing protein [Armatimonadota bacterium]
MNRKNMLSRLLTVTAVVALMTATARAQTPISLADVTSPGDPISSSSPNFPAGEAPQFAIDNDAGTKFLNFDEENVFLTVTPSVGSTVVTGVSFVTGNDSPERDPVNYDVLGSNDGANYTLIKNGFIDLPFDRGQRGSAGFYNEIAYTSYRVKVNNIRDVGAANSVQYAELELSGTLANVTPGFIADVLNGASVEPSSGNFPGGENPANVIDNDFGTKYLNFDETGTFLTFTPLLTQTVVTELAITSANDAPERDPASFLLAGSNDGVNFTTISDGSFPDFTARFQEQVVTFSNDTAYQFYRLTIPTIRDAGAANSIQFAEVRLGGTSASVVTVPEPATASLLSGGIMIVGAFVIRRRGSA